MRNGLGRLKGAWGIIIVVCECWSSRSDIFSAVLKAIRVVIRYYDDILATRSNTLQITNKYDRLMTGRTIFPMAQFDQRRTTIRYRALPSRAYSYP